MKKKCKLVEYSVIFGICFSIILSFFNFEKGCSNIRKNVLRLHITANSNSAFDQSVKLKVRDAILNSAKKEFENCNTLDDAIKVANNDKDLFLSAANAELKKNGIDYKAEVNVKKEYFSTRVYDDFTLPAGEYKSLNVKLGNGGGHNWWCVIFPSVCLPVGENATFDKTVGKDGMNIIYGGGKFIVKFRIIELFEEFKYKIKGKF